jgi:hypothetical protein
LSLKPPESDTMQALKSGWLSAGAEELDAVSLGSDAEPESPRSPQAARASEAMPTTSAIRAVFFTASS